MFLTFETTDLTPLFNWNTKQLFLYLEAEYTDTKGVSFRPSPLVFSVTAFLATVLSRFCVPSDVMTFSSFRFTNLGQK